MDAPREPAERYRLERILKSTRSGTVMEGADLRDGRPVVVKVVHPGGPERLAEARAGFERLAAALRELKHPAFPALLDAGFSPDGSAFLVFERLIGRTLERAAAGSAGKTVSYLAQAAAGLDALAGAGVLHGALAAEDFWVVDPRGGQSQGPRQQEGQVKLLGLGIVPFHQPAAEPDVAGLARVACQILHARCDAERGTVDLPPLVASSLHDPDPLRKVLERSLKPPAGGPPSAAEVRAAFLAALRRTVPAAVKPAAGPAAAAGEALGDRGIAAGAASLLPALDDDLGPRHDVLSDIPDDVLHAPPESLPGPRPAPPAGAAPARAASGNPAPRGLAASAAPAEAASATESPAAAPVSAPTSASIGVAASAPEPAPAPRRRKLVLAGAAAAVLVLGAAGLFLLTRPEAPPPALPPPAPAPPPPEPAQLRLDRAIGWMAAGDDARARPLLASLTAADQAALGPEGCARLALAQQILRLAARDGLERDLPAALAGGSLTGAVAAVRAAVAEQVMPAGLYPGAEQDYERAARLSELYAQAEAAQARNAPLQVLEIYRTLAGLFPEQRDGFELRERAAAALVEASRERARAGDYPAALARLDDLERALPEAPGLDQERETLAKHRAAEPDQQALLDKLAGFDRRRRPDEALEVIDGVEPTPHLAAAFAAEHRRFTEQLATLDREPPIVELREGYSLQYARGTVAELSFRARDDFRVMDVRVMGRRAGGGAMREVPHRRDSFGYTVELGPGYHGNGTVELYVVATDISGHEGMLGSPAQPLLVERLGASR